tara:strand:- start:1895 stop:3049 length:1155 start_codon:yes stop_codon:yes gene_type:complete
MDLYTTGIFKKNWNANTRIVCNQGGTRSSKTYSLLQLIVLRCLKETDKIWSICRKTYPALKATAMRDLIEILEKMELYNIKFHNKSDSTYKLNGNLIEFIAVDEPQKIRGRKRNFAFLNEANEFTFEDFQQLALRTTEQIYLDFNPSDEFHWIYDKVISRDDCTFIKSTYLDNPFLEEETIKEIERLKIDDNYWRIYGLGEKGVSMSTIFRNTILCDKIPERAKFIAYGLDWGFSSDPTALVELYATDTDLYMNEILFERGLTNQDIGDRMKELQIQRNDEIIADSSEPKSIEEVYRMNFNIKPSLKGKDSIRLGIDIMRRYKINITKNSINMIKEFRNYKWKQDKNGNTLPVPVDAYNHTIDAIRYICLNKLMKNNQGKYYVM